MPVSVKNLAGALLRFSGILLLLRHLCLKHRVTIIYYHNPTPVVLEEHLKYVSPRYNIITVNTLLGAIRSKTWAELPPRSLVITLDDGHKGNFDLLLVFRKFKVVPTIYLCSQIVTTCRQFWWKKVDGNVDHYKRLSNRERLHKLRKTYGFQLEKEYPKDQRQALSRTEIVEMIGNFGFGSHTCFHPILTTCSDEECDNEIRQSKGEVTSISGQECKHFCYPNGSFSERESLYVKKAGYESARTCDVGWNSVNTDPYRLKAFGVADDASVNWLAAQVSGIACFLKHVLNGGSLR